MAANMKNIKLRIKSVQSTMQITKAMELVASSKLRRAKERAEKVYPYYSTLYRNLANIVAANRDFSSVYTKKRPIQKTCYVVIAGDRGLSGGYNSNLFKAMNNSTGDSNYCVLPIGRKALEYYQRKGVEILTEEFAVAGEISVSDCFSISRLLCKGFREGSFDAIELGYTTFLSMLSQVPDVITALPLNAESMDPERMAENAPKGEDFYISSPTEKGKRDLVLYEPDIESVFNAIVPEYLAGLVYGAVCQSVASEQAARRTAMDSATKNAGEIISNLELYYNRARQAAITQEITEIVAGAEQ